MLIVSLAKADSGGTGSLLILFPCNFMEWDALKFLRENEGTGITQIG